MYFCSFFSLCQRWRANKVSKIMLELKFIRRSVETKGNIINCGTFARWWVHLPGKTKMSNKTCWWHCMCSINSHLISNSPFAPLTNKKKTIRKSFRTSTLFYLLFHFAYSNSHFFEFLLASLFDILMTIYNGKFLLRAKIHFRIVFVGCKKSFFLSYFTHLLSTRRKRLHSDFSPKFFLVF